MGSRLGHRRAARAAGAADTREREPPSRGPAADASPSPLPPPPPHQTTLILKSDDIEDDGAAELLAALAHNTVLEVLDLSGNRIDPSGEHGASQDRRVTLGFQSRPFLHTPAEAAPSGGEASGGDAASSA